MAVVLLVKIPPRLSIAALQSGQMDHEVARARGLSPALFASVSAVISAARHEALLLSPRAV
jgi:hypothetical protein